MKSAIDTLISIFETRPSFGYLGAAVPTGTGFWVLVEQSTKLGALISILLGIAVAIVTLKVQLTNRNRQLDDTNKKE